MKFATYFFLFMITFSANVTCYSASLFSFTKNTSDALSTKLVKVGNLRLGLYPSTPTIVPGKQFNLGLRLVHSTDWHSYWVNPGDSGLPTTIDFKFSELGNEWDVGEIQWPVPKRIDVGPLTNFGFEGDVLLVSRVTPPKNLKANSIIVEAKVNWLICREVCIPGEKIIFLKLPVSPFEKTGSAEADNYLELFAKGKKDLPVYDDSVNGNQFTASIDSAGKYLSLLSKQKEFDLFDNFFPFKNGLIVSSFNDYASYRSNKIAFKAEEQGWVFRIPLSQKFDSQTIFVDGERKIEGVLATSDGAGKEVTFQLVSSKEFEKKLRGFIGRSRDNNNDYRSNILSEVGIILMAAFVGGLILNLMPCVFPILGIKILSLINSGTSKKKMVAHGLGYSCGVITFMMFFALLFLSLRALGESFGWGFQLQNPAIVLLLLLLFIFLTINFLGFVELGGIFSKLSQLDKYHGFWGAFLTGLLTVLVATPCTAPFMGSAMGYAISAQASTVLAIFLSLALGIAAPYTIFSFTPKLISLLPKPGVWMVKLKQALAFPMLLSAGWLFWIFVELQGVRSVMLIWALITVLFSIVWINTNFPVQKSQINSRFRFSIGILKILMILVAAFLGYKSVSLNAGNVIDPVKSIDKSIGTSESGQYRVEWKKWEPGLPEKLSESGRFVFVDFTAAWCIVCQANKVRVLESLEIEDAFRKHRIVLVRADWTKPNELIKNEILNFNRLGIPLNVIYFPDDRKPKILPEWLNKQQILEIFNKG